MITLQYLEPGPHTLDLSPKAIRQQLRIAFGMLPIDGLLLGWDLPLDIIIACKEETISAGVKLYRWHPLLTGNELISPKVDWRTENLESAKITGFRNLDEFTFICPNRSEVKQVVFSQLSEINREKLFDGVFLDRMRFPSPMEDPVFSLACFCNDCRHAAAVSSLDLNEVRRYLLELKAPQLIQEIFSSSSSASPLAAFIKFRQETITRFLVDAITILRSENLEVGLDCFSPTLAPLVGQDITTLAPLADWTKLMIYGHALGPATLPFEYGTLLEWWKENQGEKETKFFSMLSETNGEKFIADPARNFNKGFTPEFLAAEYMRGKWLATGQKLLAGVEMVEIPGISELNPIQIKNDLAALMDVNADGLALSWDLWHIPVERLELTRDIWCSFRL